MFLHLPGLLHALFIRLSVYFSYFYYSFIVVLCSLCLSAQSHLLVVVSLASVYHSCSSAYVVFLFFYSVFVFPSACCSQLLPFSALAIDLPFTAPFFSSCELQSLFSCFHLLLSISSSSSTAVFWLVVTKFFAHACIYIPASSSILNRAI